jgi:hypothetical protein
MATSFIGGVMGLKKAFALCSLLFSMSTYADDEATFDFRKNIRHIGAQPEGFELATALSLPLSFSHSRSRFGVVNGAYLDFAGEIKAKLHYRNGLHDWSTSLFLGESYSMSPLDKHLTKTFDLLRLESRYLYNILTYLALYAHARMETSIFKSIDVHESKQTYEMRNADDSFRELITAKKMVIDEIFRPLYFQENIGAALGLIEKPFFRWEIKSALSFRQTIADAQRVRVEETADRIVIRDLRSFYEFGLLLGMSINGTLYDNKISYMGGIDTTWPAWHYPRLKHRSFMKILTIEASAGLALNLSDWSSLNYQYTATRVPEILRRFQQYHLLTLNINFNWVYQFGGPA